MVKISLNLGSQVKMFGPLIQKIVLDIVNWNENKVIIVLNIMNWNENRVQILWVQELEWKQGKIFQRKRTREPWNEKVDPQISAEVYIVISFPKEIRPACPILFLKRKTIKTSVDIRCLVIGF